MLIFGISTTTKTSSVALYDTEKGLLGEITADVEKSHSKTLMDKIDNLLDWTRKNIKDVDEVAVSIGPGSFTGVRIALATVKGLFFGRDVKIYPVNELDALAYQCGTEGELIISLIDSNKEKIYYSISRIQNNSLELIKKYSVSKLDELLDSLIKTEAVYYFAGDGAFNYSEKIKTILEKKAIFYPGEVMKIKASTLIRIRKKYTETDIYNLKPFYLEKSQAEKERENGV